MNAPWNVPPQVDRLQRFSLVLGVVCLALLLVGALRAPTQFFRSYLFAYIFWIGIPLGCWAFSMVHFLTGGKWGFGIRRLLEAGTRTFPLMVFFFVPLLFGLSRIYMWAQPAAVAADPMLQYKHPYLNVPFFLVRTVIYFAVWLGLTGLMNRWTLAQDQTGDPAMARKLRVISGPGLLLFGLTVTFASVDWVMSVEAHWFSTIYGMLFMIIAVLAALSLLIALLPLFARVDPFDDWITPQDLNDLGNLLLTFVMLWAYLSFSQFLIIWAGNLKDEIPWYMTRAKGGWAVVAVILIIFHFGVPFLLLLSRFVKRRLELLSRLAAGLVVLSAVDVYWLTIPGFLPDGPQIHWMDLLALFGIGGIWMAVFLLQVKSRPLLPLHDPEMEIVLQHEH